MQIAKHVIERRRDRGCHRVQKFRCGIVWYVVFGWIQLLKVTALGRESALESIREVDLT